ncbi:MAG TPA: DUF6285 domain-containing protein [Mycobacteriales bacterium]|nr:DUF6285 domain-containing protein [Mycobacteriales bacterium]
MSDGFPTAAQLAEAVEEFLRAELLPTLDGRLRFQTLVAANVMAVLQRELTDGPALREAHAERLTSLGVAGDRELVTAIRSGDFDARFAELLDVLRPSVEASLRIANPKHLR